MFEHPQIRHRGMRIAPDQRENALPHVANPIKLSASPVGAYRDAPALGADTDSVLSSWLGMASEEIERLRSANVI
jgi:crotonobetainyl-CoA:carnitine CoA-transferase CaiB-like acyl-CoA transferase